MAEDIPKRKILQSLAAELRRARRKFKRVSVPILDKAESAIVRLRHASSARAKFFRNGHDDFVLYRIVGNDLPPRHHSNQSYENLQFILENEQEFSDCEKWFVLNRIHDQQKRDSIVELLERKRQNFFEIKFDARTYADIPLDYSRLPGEGFFESETWTQMVPEMRQRAILSVVRLKNLYLMNNNGARNAALEHGRTRAKWVMPFDGNCFVTHQGFEGIRHIAVTQSHLPYHIVPMARVTENRLLLDPAYCPVANEEPQIIFHAKSPERFDEAYPYGRRPKVELLSRLKVPGPWSRWHMDPWDLPHSVSHTDKHLYAISKGWVGRLHSGDSTAETGPGSEKRRMDKRNAAILAAIAHMDRATGAEPGRTE